jgi:hypothetical protein
MPSNVTTKFLSGALSGVIKILGEKYTSYRDSHMADTSTTTVSNKKGTFDEFKLSYIGNNCSFRK